MRYRMIGIDLDGTLLDGDGAVSEANRAAIRAAHEAGAMVVPCTGRSWREAHIALDDVACLELGVFVTGAVVAEIATGASVDLALIEPHLAADLVDFLKDSPEAVLVCREPELAGHDYLVTGNGELTGNTNWWFELTGSKVYQQREVTVDDLHHSLRVGMVATGKRMKEIEPQVVQAFGDRVFLHSFKAVNELREGGIHVLEIFAAGVDKWRGMSWIAEQRGIKPEQIVAIGDEINDLSMLSSAGCGIAMGNAVDKAKAAADHVTLAHHDDGVAFAIERLLEGEW